MLNHINISWGATWLAAHDVGQFLSGYKRFGEAVTTVLLYPGKMPIRYAI